MISLQQLLKATVRQGASDLHLVSGAPPCLRVDGRMVRVKADVLSPEETRQLCYSILTDAQKSEFEENRELDLSFGIKDVARFRANIFYQRGVVSGVFRRIPLTIPDLDMLDLPKGAHKILGFNQGLVLVTGPTGSGKSTTIAAFLDRINRDWKGHIMTLEDPIEFVYEHRGCIVNQREVGQDSKDYISAIRHILRQDPDVVLMGELRDKPSVEAALNVAETGHLVFATLHTNSAIETISRILGVFPADQQARIRTQLSFVLNAVLSQRLVAARAGGRCLATELMLITPSIANLIREDKLHQAYGMMQVGQDKTGMTTLNQSLLQLILKRKVDVKEAFMASSQPEELNDLLKKAGV